MRGLKKHLADDLEIKVWIDKKKFRVPTHYMDDLYKQLRICRNGNRLKADYQHQEDFIKIHEKVMRHTNAFMYMYSRYPALNGEHNFLDMMDAMHIYTHFFLDVLKTNRIFIIVWNNCEANDTKIIENIHEVYPATELAKRSRFDYISLKPFLTRAKSNNAEIVELVKEQEIIHAVVSKIRDQTERAKTLEDDTFKIIESTNLRVLENESFRTTPSSRTTATCSISRQVMSPLGIFNCPVYRYVPQALLGGKHAYATAECKEVTCLYNHANWFIEDLIRNPEKLESLEASEDRQDYFL